MVLDLEKFIKKADRIVRRNRTVYVFSEALAIAMILLFVSVFFNLSNIFKHVSITEPYFGLPLDILDYTVKYEAVFTVITICLLTLLILVFFRQIKKFYKPSQKREKSTDAVERSYPVLKDRLKTAYDNRMVNTIIAATLKKSVTSDVDSVSTAGLLDKKRVLYSMTTIVVCGLFLAVVFFTGFTSPFTPDDVFDRFPNETIIQPPPTPTPESNNSSSGPTETPPIGSNPGIDIDVTLPPGAGAGPGDLLENSTNSTFYPDIYYPPESLSSLHYYEFLPEGYEDIIKDYFKKLAEQS